MKLFPFVLSATISACAAMAGNAPVPTAEQPTGAVAGTPSQGSTSSVTVSATNGNGTGTAPLVSTAGTVLGTSFKSTAGVIAAPFVATGTTISQPIETGDPTAGGKATYIFSIAKAGSYAVIVEVGAPDANSNSLFVNIDGEPTTQTMIWDIALNTALKANAVTWRGTQGAPKIWTLTAGNHQLIIRGRGAGVTVGQITIIGRPEAPKTLSISAVP